MSRVPFSNGERRLILSIKVVRGNALGELVLEVPRKNWSPNNVLGVPSFYVTGYSRKEGTTGVSDISHNQGSNESS